VSERDGQVQIPVEQIDVVDIVERVRFPGLESFFERRLQLRRRGEGGQQQERAGKNPPPVHSATSVAMTLIVLGSTMINTSFL
jgi:hypothetical protein